MLKHEKFKLISGEFRDVVLIFLEFSFRYSSGDQKYKHLKHYVAHYEILWQIVTLCNEFSVLEHLIQDYALVNVSEKSKLCYTFAFPVLKNFPNVAL